MCDTQSIWALSCLPSVPEDERASDTRQRVSVSTWIIDTASIIQCIIRCIIQSTDGSTADHSGWSTCQAMCTLASTESSTLCSKQFQQMKSINEIFGLFKRSSGSYVKQTDENRSWPLSRNPLPPQKFQARTPSPPALRDQKKNQAHKCLEVLEDFR